MGHAHITCMCCVIKLLPGSFVVYINQKTKKVVEQSAHPKTTPVCTSFHRVCAMVGLFIDDGKDATTGVAPTLT
jgi:hypothetical protein